MHGAFGEALGRALAVERAVGPLVVLGFNPAPEPGIEFFQAVNRIKDQACLKIFLEGSKKSLLLALALGCGLHPLRTKPKRSSPSRTPSIPGTAGVWS